MLTLDLIHSAPAIKREQSCLLKDSADFLEVD